MNTPADKIAAIEASLKCFAMGWCSLIPPFGLVLFPLALLNFHKARVNSMGQWNPARRYLNWGMILATIGGFISAIATVCIALASLDAFLS